MKRVALLAACVFVAAGFAAAAQTQPPEAPKPGPEHKRLGFFVGKWKGTGEVKAGPWGPAGKVTSTDTCEWFQGGFAVVCRYEGQGPTGPARGIGILSYSAEEKVYTYYAVDNSAMTMTTVPKGTVQDNTWTYTDESMMGGQKFKSRATIKEISPTEQSFVLEIQGPDGKWAPMMESKSTKTGK
jgi:hypothetical protein